MPAAGAQVSYEDLYARWERGNWRAMEIDFSGSGRQPLGNCGTAWAEASRCIEAVL